MGVLRVKPGVRFSVIAPGGFRILGALEQTARAMQVDLTITSACDGEHSGMDDPHHKGLAYDVRSHDLEPTLRAKVLANTLLDCGESFYGFLEDAGGSNEHFHFQVRKGTTYP